MHRNRVWRTVATVTHGGVDTDDLAQEAILKAWSALPTYRGEAPFGAWLCRIAVNVAHDYQRSAWKRKVFSWGAVFPDQETKVGSNDRNRSVQLVAGPDEEAGRREMQRHVRAEVAKLKEPERVPIWLIYFEEFSLAEVARLEGLPESTVRSRVKAGLKRLERTLADWNLNADAETWPPHGGEESYPAFTSRNERQRTAMGSRVERQTAVLGRGYNR